MNNHLTKNQLHLLEHSLGGSDPMKWYRNHFVACKGHTDLPDLRVLEKLGLMKESPYCPVFSPDYIGFQVTDAGKTVLKQRILYYR